MPDAPAYDAAIVGGGPAGCSAAISLAARGARVVLLEARAYPHDKLCGEFLSPECLPLLYALGLAPALRALGPVPIDTAQLTAPDGAAWQSALPGQAWGLTRQALDHAMAQRAEAAGADLRSGLAVTAITGSLAEGFTLQTGRGPALNASVVIAAHGKRAALDRSLGRRFLRKPQPYLALKAHFSGPPLPRRIDLHGFPGGYCGMSEIESDGGPRMANVCLLVHESVFQRASLGKPDPVAAFMDWLLKQNPRLEAWLSQARRVDDRWLSIAQVPFGPKRPVVNEVLMAGDSAGLIAPLAGDGIAMALRGGQMAADYTLGFLAGSGSSAQLARGYASAWQREFGARLRLGRLLQPLMLRPRLLGPALRLLNAAPALARYLVMHTRAPAAVP